jgi:putative phosphoesterase
MTTVGVISDTHGLLRPQALDALRGCDVLIHAGDIGAPEVLEALRELAPLTAVRGNNDTAPWATSIPEDTELHIGQTRIHVLHDLAQLGFDAQSAGYRVVVAGHSHRPRNEWRGGVLFFNPGSAGPRRFRLPVTVGKLQINASDVQGTIIDLLPT